jgi:hypothetical protein
MLWCFLVNVDLGRVVFLQAGFIVTEHICWSIYWHYPNIRNLYRKASIVSTTFFIAVNSDPKVDICTEFCLLLNHIVGALLQNKGI